MVGSSPNSFTPGARDDEFGSIGQRHARAIDGLVAEPSAVELVGFEIDDGLVDGRVEHLEIHLQAEVGGEMEARRDRRRCRGRARQVCPSDARPTTVST